MSIIDRLNMLVRANFNAMGGDDDRRRTKDALADMEITLREARQNVSRAMDDERHLERELDAGRREEEVWERRAMEALRNGDEDRARAHLVERHRVARRNQALLDELKERRTYMSDLLRGLEALEAKLDAVRTRAPREARRESRTQREPRATPPPGGRRDAGEARSSAAPPSYARPSHVVDDDVRRWEAMHQSRPQGAYRPRPGADRRLDDAQTAVDRGMATLDAVESRIEALEAEADASWEIETGAGAPDPGGYVDPTDDPLYDPRIAELERRFQELEQAKKLDDLKKKG